MQRIFHTPEGVRDIYNGECSQKHHLQAEIYKVFRSYGYEEIETPSIEYFEVFSKEVGTVPSRDLTSHRPYPEHVRLILTRISR